MTLRSAYLLILLAAPVSAGAAAATTVKVNPKGTLRLPAELVRRVSTRTAPLVCVEFPPVPRPKAPPKPKRASPVKPAPAGANHEHAHEPAPNAPVRVFVARRRDGSVEVYPRQIGGIRAAVPGKPGTAYTATIKQGKIVLAKRR